MPWFRLGEPGVIPRWRVTNLPPLAYCSHTLGPLLDLMGDRAVSVSGVCGGRARLGEAETFPLETAVLQTEKGAIINLTNGFLLGHPMSFFLALYGTAGSVRVMNVGGVRAMLSTEATGDQWQEIEMPWTDRPDGRDHLQIMVDEFIESVRTDTAPPFDEARSMDFCLPGVLAHESALRGGERLEVPLF